MRVTVPVALIIAFTAEMIAGGGGVGAALMFAQRFLPDAHRVRLHPGHAGDGPRTRPRHADACAGGSSPGRTRRSDPSRIRFFGSKEQENAVGDVSRRDGRAARAFCWTIASSIRNARLITPAMPAYAGALAFIRAGEAGPAGRPAADRRSARRAHRVPLSKVTLTAPVVPATILCSGSNYTDHNKEKANTPISGKEPRFFVKTADCVIGPGEHDLARRSASRRSSTPKPSSRS